MTAPFDMYREWLGVAEERRPPTCYGILDLEQGEARPEVIKQHARMQTDKLAPYRHGLHAEFTLQLHKNSATSRIGAGKQGVYAC